MAEQQRRILDLLGQIDALEASRDAWRERARSLEAELAAMRLRAESAEADWRAAEYMLSQVGAVPTPDGLVAFFAHTPEDAERIRASVF